VREVARPWILAAAAAVTLLAVAFAIATVATARRPSPAPAAAAIAARPVLAAPPARPFLMFISLVPDAAFKHVVIAPLAAPDGPRYVTPLQCDRV